MQDGDATVPSRIMPPPVPLTTSDPVQDVVFKRKFRWTFEADFPFGKLDPCFVRVASRPMLNVEELNFLDGTAWIPGNDKWEKITVTAFDITTESVVGKQLFSLLSEAYQFYDLSKYDVTKPVEPPEDKWGTCKLKLYDGCGREMESWELGQSFISKINFGELDYSSTEDTTIDIELTYKTVKYTSSANNPLTTMPPSLSPRKSGSMTIGELGLNGNFVID